MFRVPENEVIDIRYRARALATCFFENQKRYEIFDTEYLIKDGSNAVNMLARAEVMRTAGPTAESERLRATAATAFASMGMEWHLARATALQYEPNHAA